MSQSPPFTQLAERISQISYTLLGQTPLRTGFLLRRGILYALLSILVAAGYVLLVSGLSLIFGEFITANNPLLIGLTVLALAVILTPLCSRWAAFSA